MAHLYKMTEWQGASGLWYCNDVTELNNNSSSWWIPARVLGITPAQLIKVLKEQYNATVRSYDEKTNHVVYSWVKQSDMRKFKNYVNAQARKKNFIVGRKD